MADQTTVKEVKDAFLYNPIQYYFGLGFLELEEEDEDEDENMSEADDEAEEYSVLERRRSVQLA
jgi:hypothetical protein